MKRKLRKVDPQKGKNEQSYQKTSPHSRSLSVPGLKTIPNFSSLFTDLLKIIPHPLKPEAQLK